MKKSRYNESQIVRIFMANPCCEPEFISTALAEWAQDHRIDFDVKLLLENEGFTGEIKQGFIVGEQ